MSATAVNRTLWPTRRVHMPAFFGALLLAPLIITGATFWLFVPLAALFMGGPLYLILGGPLLLWHLSRKPCDASETAWLAVLANVAALVCSFLFAAAMESKDLMLTSVYYTGFGFIFAPLWGWMFGLLYSRFTRNHA